MSDVDLVIRALRRLRVACAATRVRDPVSGGEVSAHQAGVLASLDAVDPTMVGELAEHFGVTPSTMSLTLKRLEAAGYVRRDRDPADRRVRNVRLTEAGVRVREARSDFDSQSVAEVLAQLGAVERSQAIRGLALMRRAADELIRDGAGAAG